MGQIIAPRADGEGSLGTATLHWGDVRTDKINGASIAEGGAATTSIAGLMSAADKVKLDGVPTPTEGDAGKVLAVTEGETGYEAIPLPDPLPEISEGDAGKAVVVNDTEDGYELGDHLSGYEFETVSVTSTNDATSATAAPLKSAGGLAVAKGARIGGGLWLGGGLLNGVDFFRFQAFQVAAATSNDISITTPGSTTHEAHVYFISTRSYDDYEICSIQTFIVTVWGTTGINVVQLSRVDGSTGNRALTITHPSESVLRFTSVGTALVTITLTRLQ